MARKIITIVGVTGTQGASVADVFLKEGGWHVRGITRDPSKPSSQEWADKGVELIEGNINDVATLKSAFAGSNVIYGVTDFWGVVYDPKTQALASSTGKTETEIAYEAEKQQACNIADAAYATIETLDRLVFSTLSHTRKWSNGKYTHNLHFDAKWEGVEYLKATYPTLDKKTSYLQVGLYVTNWKKGLQMARPNKQPDGTFKLSLPTDGDAPVPLVEPRQDTGKFAKALVQVEPGKNLLGYGSLISWNEFAALWGKVHGVTCRYERLDRKVLEAAVPGCIGEELADMFEYIGEFGYDGRDPSVVYPENLGIDVPVYTMEKYIKDEEWPEV
ncbi:hypothetical protein FOPG_17880 [Fusarium oxysporum f. sp. conglutinans race 2 54008]|uniref:NmrA-like domain-containing protein n=2 Tax=Fusarium oxysporum f. sp. conglutinans TaxID=100902 RepID=A0A8H6GBS1_FUSOX|nr:hypothetical protein FOPG_17880 [Fusarium oxysporum f. sp. conglutinans race 2 54008]KAF6515289.1 hypothetical protein HZS61_005195 [Fusarium oxysporum f. sp. conglutinans]KAG6980132.1 NmrA-like family domain-containing protein 1 [Fusarium oxysporum f. sp. conglutinans]KAI8401534.1 hypothetical protein FOFC_18403 [Fusarium oxysporum]